MLPGQKIHSSFIIPLWPACPTFPKPTNAIRTQGTASPIAIPMIPMVCLLNQRWSQLDQPSHQVQSGSGQWYRSFVIIYIKLPFLSFLHFSSCRFGKSTITYSTKKDPKRLDQKKGLCSANVLCSWTSSAAKEYPISSFFSKYLDSRFLKVGDTPKNSNCSYDPYVIGKIISITWNGNHPQRPIGFWYIFHV